MQNRFLYLVSNNETYDSKYTILDYPIIMHNCSIRVNLTAAYPIYTSLELSQNRTIFSKV